MTCWGVIPNIRVGDLGTGLRLHGDVPGFTVADPEGSRLTAWQAVGES